MKYGLSLIALLFFSAWLLAEPSAVSNRAKEAGKSSGSKASTAPCACAGSATDDPNRKIDVDANSCYCAMNAVYTDPNNSNNVLYYLEITNPAQSCSVFDIAYTWSNPIYAPVYCNTQGTPGVCDACNDFSFLEKSLPAFPGMSMKQNASCKAKDVFPAEVKYPESSAKSFPKLGIQNEFALFVSYTESGSSQTTYVKLFNILYKFEGTNYPHKNGALPPKYQQFHIGYEVDADLDGNGTVDPGEVALLAPEPINEPDKACRKLADKDSGDKALLCDDSPYVRKINYHGTRYLVLTAQKP